jgi:hypothetical protein
MLSDIRVGLVLLMCLSLIGCGTTSSIYDPRKSSNNINLASYDHVIVNDFYDRVPKVKNQQKIRNVGKEFAYLITTKLRSHHAFKSVKMNKKNSQKKTLLVEGKITQYDEGNTTLRNLIGLGIGSAHFDAKVYIKDNNTKRILGNIDVDKYSFPLGGIIGGLQDVHYHMNSASSAIAEEIVQAKVS